jgi:hypothetical protein
MKLKWIGYLMALLVIILAIAFGLEIRKVLVLEENGLATRAVCESLIKFVEKEKRWPDSWEELLIPSDTIESYKSRVSVEFGLSLKDVADSMVNGRLIVFPKVRALDSYQTAYEVLRDVVFKEAERQTETSEIELR